MRVTKIMQEYIREEITKRIEPRYEDAKKTKISRQAVLTAFINHINKELNRIADDMVETFLSEHPEYTSTKPSAMRWVHVYDHHLNPIDDDISKYYRTMNDEIDNKYKETVIALELGGTKADLDELLENI